MSKYLYRKKSPTLGSSSQTSFRPTGYTFVKQLGKGSYGSVDLYSRKSDQQQVAIKSQPLENVYRDNLGELDILTRFHHPNLMHLYEFVIENNTIFYVMPYGKSGKGYRIDELQAFELLDGLNFLHTNNYYHCDIKPDNILFIEDVYDNRDIAVITDFGLAKSINIPPSPCITENYRPPEFLQKYKSLFPQKYQSYVSQRRDGRIGDIWSMGVSLVYLITGIHPFDGPRFTNIQSTIGHMILYLDNREMYLRSIGVPDKYLSLILGMLEPNIVQRYTTSQCLLEPVFEDFIASAGTLKTQRDSLRIIEYSIPTVQLFLEDMCNKHNVSAYSFITALDLYYRVYPVISTEYDPVDTILTCLMIACYFVSDKSAGDKIRQYALTTMVSDTLNEIVARILIVLNGELGTQTLYDWSFSVETLKLSWNEMLTSKYISLNLEQFGTSLLQYQSSSTRLTLSNKYNVRCDQLIPDFDTTDFYA